MTDRKKVIQILEIMMKKYLTLDKDEIDALQFAIDSIKVDRAYDLAYEKVDFIEIPKVATNGDMIKAMFPNIQWGNECDGVFYGYKTNDRVMAMLGVDFNWWNAPYKKGGEHNEK